VRIDSAEDQTRHPVRQRLGLAGASSRRYQQRRRDPVFRPDAINDRTPLRRV
jgi:hypothetical protein